MLQHLQEATISLQDLQEMDQYASKDIHPNQFAAYICHEQNRKMKAVQLISLSAKQMPTIPMRRVSCLNCRNMNISCQKCQQCKSKLCCRDLSCIYDYKHWKENPLNSIYYDCNCVKNKDGYSSTTFDIDWRLMSIINKIPTKLSPTSSFHLYFAAGMLWVTEQSQTYGKRICKNIYYEDNFGLFYFHQKQIREGNPINLSQSNIRNFTNLLKVNIKKYLQVKDAWEVSNLEEECQEIADTFFSHKKLQAIKTNLQNPNDNAFANMPSVKFQGKFSQALVSSKSKNDKTNYQGCSEFTNQQILFYYCFKSQLLFVRNAKLYEGDNQFSNIRGIRIKFVDKENIEKAIWFKDRKGDIFAINKSSLSIFRFNVPQKCYLQFILDTHPYFQRVDSAASLIYVQQKDIVYYFSPKDFKQSFHFSLYRPKGNEDSKAKKQDLSKYSCTSVKIQETFGQKQKNIKSYGSFCKAVYVMEDYRFKKGKDARKELVPVIYLLVQRQNYLPMGIGVFKIVHPQQGIIISQVPSSGSSSQGNQSQKNINFNLGVVFTLHNQKAHKLFYYTLDNSKPILLSAKVVQNDGKQNLHWSDQYLELNGCNEVKLQFQKKESDKYLRIINFMICSTETNPNNRESQKYANILINDIAGIPSNNDFRLLGYNSKTGRVVQLYLTYNEGSPSWRIYDLA